MNQSKYPLILPQEPAWQRRSEDAGMQHPGPRCPTAKARRGVLVGGVGVVGGVVIARYSTRPIPALWRAWSRVGS